MPWLIFIFFLSILQDILNYCIIYERETRNRGTRKWKEKAHKHNIFILVHGVFFSSTSFVYRKAQTIDITVPHLLHYMMFGLVERPNIDLAQHWDDRGPLSRAARGREWNNGIMQTYSRFPVRTGLSSVTFYKLG